MKPIRLNTIGKVIWFFLILIVALLIVFIISLFKKEKPNSINQENQEKSEKILDYTASKMYTYDFSSTEVNRDLLIKESATYKLTGNNESYKIIVDSKDSVVKLVLTNFNTDIVDDLIDIKNAHKVIIEIEDGTESSIGQEITSLNENIPVIIKSESDIDIIGGGVLKVNTEGVFMETKKDINFKGVTIELNNVKDGIKTTGDLTLNSGVLYIKADNEAIISKGNINIDDGLLVVRADNSIKNDGLFVINKGKVFIASLNEIKKPNANSLQKTIMLNFKEITNKMLFINDTSSFILAYAGEINYQHVLYSDDFQSKEYILYESGKISGTQIYGLYKIEEAEGGKQLTSSDLENSNRFEITETTNVYNDVVKK